MGRGYRRVLLCASAHGEKLDVVLYAMREQLDFFVDTDLINHTYIKCVIRMASSGKGGDENARNT